MSEFTTNINQLKLLLWKNFILQKRSIWLTVLELILPMLFFFILIPIRKSLLVNDIKEDIFYTAFSIDSLPSELIPDDEKNPDNKWILAYQPKNVDLIENIMRKVKNDLNIVPLGDYFKIIIFYN